MISQVRWPPPPYRVSKGLAISPAFRAGFGLVLGGAGATLVAATGFMLFAWNSDRPSTFADRWLPMAVIFAVGVTLLRLAWTAARSVPGRQRLAKDAANGRIIDADVLFSDSFSRGGTSWTFAYSNEGRRFYGHRVAADSRIKAGAPLFMDEAQTRGAVLVVDGAGELILGNVQPLLLDKVQREAISEDVARLVARPTVHTVGGLNVLEVQTPAGAARDYVHFFREACTAEGGQRDRMIAKRDAAARRLTLEALDDLLQDCRRHAAQLD